ncbi:hypothetical protein PN466_16070 [Roseofilum reptotaenium CS-1145]|uniref:Uncharacterized protein n=1 Tax=Roseofilum reptotaenium AO1-A TaxID=1925591 RepID=A0A1L9QTR2_9CYAN|nr:hypothetical protein [Roseofilum reptotaenium CS-1145]OJJ26061.1 hypothetical protein BI308_07650 [Roseofilum reptotaenium AO1-A]
MIKRKFAGELKAEIVLEEHERNPEIYEAPLKKKLLEAGADWDREILAAAQKLLDEMESKESTPGSFHTIAEKGRVRTFSIAIRAYCLLPQTITSLS